MRTTAFFYMEKNIICISLYNSNKYPIFKRGSIRNILEKNALMQYESYNYKNFIIFFAKYFYLMDFIFTLDS